MKTARLLAALLTTFLLTAPAYAQTGKPAKDYLHVAGPILFDKEAYALTWTAHPATNFYKQEYVRRGDNLEKFTGMILLDMVTGDVAIKDVVAAKVAELQKMKESNPLVNYEVMEKNGEYMLDFLLSANAPDGKTVSVVERNVYRYQATTDKAGQKGVLLFGVSSRSYGDDIDKFLAALKAERYALVTKVAAFSLPKVTIGK